MNRLSIRTIGETVAAVCHVEWREVTSARRDRRICLARHIGIWQAARRTPASLSLIGRVYGRRDHSTIAHAIQRGDALAAAGEPMVAASEAMLDGLEAALGHRGIAEALEADAIELARRITASERAATSVSVEEVQALAEHILAANEEIRWRSEMDDPLRRLLTAEDALDDAVGTAGERAAREERRQALSLVLRTFAATSRSR